MKRPWLLRTLPDRLRIVAAWHLYRPHRENWLPLYADAPLRFAPDCRMELVPGDILSDHIAFSGIWDLPLSRHLIRRARAGGVLVEIGANLGYFSLLWASAQPGNRCFAFEASPRILPLLRRNIERNRLHDRIEVFPVAAGKEAGRGVFDLGPADQTGWGGLASAPEAGQVSVEVVRVDEVLEYPGQISFLKVDVEGADTWALLGCEGLFREKRVREVWFEQNKPRMRALSINEREAHQYLAAHGFSLMSHGDPTADLVDWSATLAEGPA